MGHSYLKALRKPDAVITTTIANATVKALIKSNPGFAGDIDIICCGTSLFRHHLSSLSSLFMIKNRHFWWWQKGDEFLCLYDIGWRVKEFNISKALMITLDQTPLKYVPINKRTIAERKSTPVSIEWRDDKGKITGIFTITLSGKILHMKLIYLERTTQSISRYNFSEDFCLILPVRQNFTSLYL